MGKSNNGNTAMMSVIIGYLKKIITWQSMSLAAAIIMPLIIYKCQKDDNLFFKSDKKTILKDSIKTQVNYIESEFNPSDIVLAPDFESDIFFGSPVNTCVYPYIIDNL